MDNPEVLSLLDELYRLTPHEQAVVISQVARNLSERAEGHSLTEPSMPNDAVERLRWFLDSEHAVHTPPSLKCCLHTLLRSNGASNIMDLADAGVFDIPEGQDAPSNEAVRSFRKRANRILVGHRLKLSVSTRSHVARILLD